jgi:hypothetical protein
MRRLRSAAAAGLLPLLGLVPVAGWGQGYIPPAATQPAPAAPGYSFAQLDQMLAPIALYPDALLTQILMAATYPAQLVEAGQWLENPGNAAIPGPELVGVLQPLPWDPSVKSLVPFPQIIRQLNEQLDWTQSLGDAFVNQQTDVLEQVQVLRAQAERSNHLVSTPQIRVVHEGPAVIIEPANPAVVYVPVYNPQIVYGTWAYAAYPPLFFPPRAGFFVGPVGVGIGFSVGFGVVGPLWGWGRPSWGARGVIIDNEFYSRISFDHARFVGGATWHHIGPVGFVGGFHAGAGFHGGGGFHAGAGLHTAGERRGFAHGAPGRAVAAHGNFAHATSSHRGNSGGREAGPHAASHGGHGHGESGRGHAASNHGSSHKDRHH